jgi:hypothetical protein
MPLQEFIDETLQVLEIDAHQILTARTTGLRMERTKKQCFQ